MWDSVVWERLNVRVIWPASEWNGGWRFRRGTVRGRCQWLGYSTIFKLVGQGGLSKKAQNVQDVSRYNGIQRNTS